MGEIHLAGDCPNCTNGELAFAKRSDTGAVFVECLECHSGYLDERVLRWGPFVLLVMGECEFDYESASRDDVEIAGLADLADVDDSHNGASG